MNWHWRRVLAGFVAAAAVAGGGRGAMAQPAPATQPASADQGGAPAKTPIVEPFQRPVQIQRESTTMDPAVLGSAPGEPAGKLRKEGDFVVNRRGRLARSAENSRLMFVFEADATGKVDPSMTLLPCQYLQNMENLVNERGERTEFIISGQITTYRGANYLVPTTWRPAEGGGAASAPSPRSAPMPAVATPDSSTPPIKDASGQVVPSPEKVMGEMTSQIERMPGSAAAPRPASGSHQVMTVDSSVVGGAPGEHPVKLRQEGEFVINRRGRLSRGPSNSQMLFVFDADASSSPEPPMVILPCAALQALENLVQERGDRIIFMLSGQITTYRGANYLLPTIWTLAQDRGNLQR